MLICPDPPPWEWFSQFFPSLPQLKSSPFADPMFGNHPQAGVVVDADCIHWLAHGIFDKIKVSGEMAKYKSKPFHQLWWKSAIASTVNWMGKLAKNKYAGRFRKHKGTCHRSMTTAPALSWSMETFTARPEPNQSLTCRWETWQWIRDSREFFSLERNQYPKKYTYFTSTATQFFDYNQRLTQPLPTKD